MAEATARDALIAEMLGDIGKLHDGVEALKKNLPALSEEITAKIAPVVGTVVDASNALTKITEALRQESRITIDTARGQIGKEQAKAIANLEQRASELNSGLRETLREAIRSEVAQDVHEMVNEVRKAARTELFEKAVYGAIGGFSVFVLSELYKLVMMYL